MSYTNIAVPTCSSNFKTLGPYDDNLLNEFNKQLELERSNQPNSCPCQNNLNDLGYSQNLTTCIQCFGLTNSPSQTYSPGSQPWGCDSCQNVVAPISYYENTTVANADQIEKYYTDSVYKNNVDVFWQDATPCDKGTAIKNTCINNLEYFINTPQSTNPSPTPSSSNTSLSTGAIICIIIGSIFLVVLIFIYFWKKRSKHSVHSKQQKVQKQQQKLQKQQYKLRKMQEEKEQNERLEETDKQLKLKLKQAGLEIEAFKRQGKGKPDPNLNYGGSEWSDERKAQIGQYYPQQPQQQGQQPRQPQQQHRQPQQQGQQHRQQGKFSPPFIKDDYEKFQEQRDHNANFLSRDDYNRTEQQWTKQQEAAQAAQEAKAAKPVQQTRGLMSRLFSTKENEKQEQPFMDIDSISPSSTPSSQQSTPSSTPSSQQSTPSSISSSQPLIKKKR